MSSLRERIDLMLLRRIADDTLDDEADAIMAEIQPELDAKDAELKAAMQAYWREREQTEAMRLAKDTEIERLRALLTEILTHFHEHGHPGRAAVRTCWIDADVVTGWRRAAALDQGAKERQ